MHVKGMPYRGYRPSDEDRETFLASVRESHDANYAVANVVNTYGLAIEGLFLEISALKDRISELEKDLEFAQALS